jgi:hypothetical protein
MRAEINKYDDVAVTENDGEEISNKARVLRLRVLKCPLRRNATSLLTLQRRGSDVTLHVLHIPRFFALEILEMDAIQH